MTIKKSRSLWTTPNLIFHNASRGRDMGGQEIDGEKPFHCGTLQIESSWESALFLAPLLLEEKGNRSAKN